MFQKFGYRVGDHGLSEQLRLQILDEILFVNSSDFLKKTGAVAFAAPYVLTSNALAAPGRVGANDRVYIGHIGINWMGGDHLKMTSKDKNNPVVALCDLDAIR